MSPFQHVLDQLTDVLKKAEEASKSTLKGNVSPELEAQVKWLEDQIVEFTALNDKAVAKAGLTEEEVRETLAHPPPQLQEEYRNLIERAYQLSLIAKHNRDAVILGMKQTKNEKKAPTTRQKKFDRVGGRKKMETTITI